MLINKTNMDIITDIPLSFSQRRLWLLNRADPGSGAFSQVVTLELAGSVNITTLEKSIAEILRRHSILRTVFHTKNDTLPIQASIPPAPFALPVTDLQALPLEQREKTAREDIIHKARLPFLLTGESLPFRTVLYCLEPQRYWFVFTYHRIIMDDLSAGIFYQELQVLYQAFANGDPSPLPELSAQYSDFAAWQHVWYTGETLRPKLEFWLKKFKDPLPILDLNTDHLRPPVQTSSGSNVSFRIDPALVARLKSFCVQEDVTLDTALLAAFQCLLYRYTGQEDFILGTSIPNRLHSETEKLIGVFANTLPLRVDFSGQPNFHQVLQRVRETSLDASAYQDLPFEILVETLQPDRKNSRAPLFQVMFTMQSHPVPDAVFAGLQSKRIDIDLGTSLFDLSLIIEETAGDLLGKVEYSTDLFERETINRLVDHFTRLMEGALADPTQPVTGLPILSNAERHQVLFAWNDTARMDPRLSYAVPQLFEQQVERTPDAPAIFDPKTGEELTYSGLNQRANQLAHYLKENGAGSERIIAVCLERSVDAIASLLAILKTGGAYLPIDPDYPQERMHYMLEDSQSMLLLTSSNLASRAEGTSARIVCLDAEQEQIKCQPSGNLKVAILPDQLAYIIYTSGSTGKPKGVMVEHHSLVNHNLAAGRIYQLNERDHVMQFASLSFDFSLEEILPPLIHGSKLVLRPEGEVPSGLQMCRWISDWGITVLELPTAYWHEWVSALAFAQQPAADQSQAPLPGCLRLVTVGGEKAHAEKLAQWQKLAGKEVIWLNTYGPTEGTIIATWYDPPETLPDNRLPIGWPIDNLRVYILDSALQPVPVGVAGELLIAGEGVARGYKNRPDLTAERFLPDPFYPGQRMYRTGDRAYWLPDGSVEFLGRVDHQVKIHGFRVELGEIENTLLLNPALREAAVVPVNGKEGSVRLAAYIVAGNLQQPPAVEDLQAFIKGRLPAYMVPAAFVFLDHLPLNGNGKIDKAALPQPTYQDFVHQRQYTAPRNQVEAKLAEIWEANLNIHPIGIHDNYFDLGGESLRLIALLAAVERHFRKEVPLNIFFQAATIAGLAELLQEKKAETNWRCLVPIQPRGEKIPLFCIHAEGGVFFYNPLAQALGPSQPVYGLQALGLDGKSGMLSNVEDMAALYIQEMRIVQPHGPYQIASYQMGGIIVLEMARQLRAAGETIGLVGLIDTYGPNYPVASQIQHKLLVHAKQVGSRSFSEQLKYFKKILRRGSKNFSSLVVGPILLKLKLPLPHSMRYEVLRETIDQAVRNYKQPPYDGEVTLFRATRQPPIGIPDRYLGLRPLVSGEIKVLDVEASHMTIVEEAGVKNLAAMMQPCFVNG